MSKKSQKKMKVFRDVSTLGSSTLPIKHVLQEARTLSSHNTLKTTTTTKRQEGPVLAGPSCLIQILGTSGFVLMFESSDTCSPRDVGQVRIENVHCRLSNIQSYLLRLGQHVHKCLQQTNDFSSPKDVFSTSDQCSLILFHEVAPFMILNCLRWEQSLLRMCMYNYASISGGLPPFPTPLPQQQDGTSSLFPEWTQHPNCFPSFDRNLLKTFGTVVSQPDVHDSFTGVA